jgi:hypothetical protein
LADLAKVKGTAEAFGPRDFASRTALEGLRGHEEELREELRAAEMLESGSDLELVFAGDPVRGHLIQAGFLGNFLNKIQQLVNALARTTAHPPGPRNVVAENRLMVCGWAPPFVVRLRLPTREELGQTEEPASPSVLDALADVLGQHDPSENTVRLVSQPGVRNHYRQLLEVVAKQGASIRYRTRRHPYGDTLDARQARERVEWLDLLQATEERLTLSGTFVGGSIESARFELKVGEDLYRGKVSEGAKHQLKRLTLGSPVEAELRVATMTPEEGAFEPATAYVLVAVRSAVPGLV